MVKEENWACAWLPPSACPPAKVAFQEKATSSLGKIYCCGEGRKIKDENLRNNRTDIYRSLHPDEHLAVLSKEYHELVILTIGKGCNLEDITVYNFDIWMISSFLSCVDFGHSFSVLWYRYKSYSLHRHMSEITVSLFQTCEGILHTQLERCFQSEHPGKKKRGILFWERWIWLFPYCWLRRWLRFFLHHLSSLWCYAARYGEKLHTTVCGQDLSFFMLPALC